MDSLDDRKPESSTSDALEPLGPPDSENGSKLITPSNPPEIPVSPNPWEEGEAFSSQFGEVESAAKEMPSLDSSIFDHRPFDDVKTNAPTPNNDTSKVEILNEFDPLGSIEEKAARDAWADSEGHPPPPPPRTPSPPLPPMKDLHISPHVSPEGSSGASATAMTSPTPFASLASFAKNFSLPIVKSRSQLLDGSTKVTPSLSTVSSNQQDSAKLEASDSGKSPVSGLTTPNRGGDGTASSSTKLSDATFDFQIFLDQMKTRSAEPVSRYLRS